MFQKSLLTNRHSRKKQKTNYLPALFRFLISISKGNTLTYPTCFITGTLGGLKKRSYSRVTLEPNNLRLFTGSHTFAGE